MDTFWEKLGSPFDQKWLSSLVALIGHRRPPLDYVVIPDGVEDRELTSFPLRPRTAHAIKNVLQKKGKIGRNGISVGELMALRNFGTVSLLDLMCVAEIALSDRALDEDAPNEVEPVTQEAVTPTVEQSHPISKWGSIIEPLDVLLSVANEFYGATTVGEVMKLDLLRLASTIGVGEELESLEIRDLISSNRIADTVIERLTALQVSMSPSEQVIVEQRLLAATPKRLKELGQMIGVSRERVRQIASRLSLAMEKRVGKEVEIIASVLGEKLPPVVDIEELDRSIKELFTGSETSVVLAVQMVKKRLNYSCVDGVCMNETALEVVDKLREVAEQEYDDVGLINQTALRDHLPSEEWDTSFRHLVKRCGFHFIGGQLAKRTTVGARAKATLIDIGRVATTEEIVERSGIKASQVAKQFGEICTVDRAGINRWGLTEWIEDVYDGVTEEIIQRISEDGGATTFERLVKEIPRLFGVSKSSVQTIVGTKQFVIQDGMVSIAEESSIVLRNLQDVFDGRTLSGDPYWTFVVENRYFDGHSLPRFPAELAKELGCKPNDKIRVEMDYPSGCEKLSVSWRLSSTTGANLGYLSEPLRLLGVSGGDRVRVVIKDSGAVELHPEIDSGIEVRENSAESYLQQILDRRSVTGRAR